MVQIVRRVSKIAEPSYVVHWYRYSSEDNACEPLEHLAKHFVDAYWRRENDGSPTQNGGAKTIPVLKAKG